MSQPVLSLIQIYLKWLNREKKIQLLMKIEKRIELFVETCIKYLRGPYDLKRIVFGKNFEKYNAV